MKTYCLTLSQAFPSTHPRAGQPTHFDENLRLSKLHTIRANYDYWAKRFEKIKTGEACLSVRQWVGKPYGKGSTQKELARLTREDGIGLQKLEFKDIGNGFNAAVIDGKPWPREILASNDGLSLQDWRNWFRDYDFSKPMAIIQFTNFRY